MRALLALQERIQETDALITRLERTLTNESPRSAWANLRSLENRLEGLQQHFFDLADKNSRDVCRYRMFNPGERYKLSGFSKALSEFQNTCSLTFAALRSGPRLRGAISADVEEATSFDFAYAFTGSVGVVLTIENERLLLGGTLLDDAMSLVFDMAKAKNPSEIAEFSKKVGPPPIRALYRWATAHVAGQIGADIEWRKSGGVAHTLVMQEPELERLRLAIASTSDVEVETYNVRGELLAWDIPGKWFRLRSFDGDEMAGSVSDDALPAGESVEIPSIRSASLERRTKVHYSTEKEEHTWKLTRLLG